MRTVAPLVPIALVLVALAACRRVEEREVAGEALAPLEGELPDVQGISVRSSAGVELPWIEAVLSDGFERVPVSGSRTLLGFDERPLRVRAPGHREVRLGSRDPELVLEPDALFEVEWPGMADVFLRGAVADDRELIPLASGAALHGLGADGVWRVAFDSAYWTSRDVPRAGVSLQLGHFGVLTTEVEVERGMRRRLRVAEPVEPDLSPLELRVVPHELVDASELSLTLEAGEPLVRESPTGRYARAANPGFEERRDFAPRHPHGAPASTTCRATRSTSRSKGSDRTPPAGASSTGTSGVCSSSARAALRRRSRWRSFRSGSPSSSAGSYGRARNASRRGARHVHVRRAGRERASWTSTSCSRRSTPSR